MLLSEQQYYNRQVENGVLSKAAYRHLTAQVVRRQEAFQSHGTEALRDVPSTSAELAEMHRQDFESLLKKQPNVQTRVREVAEHRLQRSDWPSLGLLGEPGVNVLPLNLALDKAASAAMPATALVDRRSDNGPRVPRICSGVGGGR